MGVFDFLEKKVFKPFVKGVNNNVVKPFIKGAKVVGGVVRRGAGIANTVARGVESVLDVVDKIPIVNAVAAPVSSVIRKGIATGRELAGMAGTAEKNIVGALSGKGLKDTAKQGKEFAKVLSGAKNRDEAKVLIAQRLKGLRSDVLKR